VLFIALLLVCQSVAADLRELFGDRSGSGALPARGKRDEDEPAVLLPVLSAQCELTG
jgi:hypothetical protein